jgi:hypothetical protein
VRQCEGDEYLLKEVRECRKCKSGCVGCSSYEVCTACAKGLSLGNATCVENCVDGMFSQNWVCVAC